jgi:hypothetical protein
LHHSLQVLAQQRRLTAEYFRYPPMRVPKFRFVPLEVSIRDKKHDTQFTLRLKPALR